MGVLQRFERRLGGLVEGAFAKVFKGGVEPVEIASALARETDDRRAVSSNRVLVPNEFAVELASGDFTRLAPYDRALCDELAEMVREHAAEQRYTFVGPVSVRMSEATDLDVGVFRIRSSVAAADPGAVGGRRARPRPSSPGAPRLLITTKAAPGPGGGGEREYPLDAETTVIGRSVECDIRLNDTGVSRRHGEIRRLPDGQFLYVDAGSTNGSLVNGRAATQVKLVSGDKIELGTATIVFRREDGRATGPGRSAARGTPPPARAGQRETPPPARRPAPAPDDPYRRDSTPRGGQVDPYADRDRRGEPGYRDDPYRDRARPAGERGAPYRDRDRSSDGYDRSSDGHGREPDRDRGHEQGRGGYDRSTPGNGRPGDDDRAHTVGPDRGAPRGRARPADRGPDRDRGYEPSRDQEREFDRGADRGRAPDRGPARGYDHGRDGRDPYARDLRSGRVEPDRRSDDPYRGSAGSSGSRRRGGGSGASGGSGPAPDGLEALEDVYDAETRLPGRATTDPPGIDGDRGRSRSDRGW